MSIMAKGIIQQPYHLAMHNERTCRQFYSHAQVLLEERDQMEATIAQQAQMIEHLRGGPTPLYTAVDMTTAAAQGFRDGRKSVGLLLSKGFNTLETGGGKSKIVMEFADRDDAWAAYTEISTIARLAGEE